MAQQQGQIPDLFFFSPFYLSLQDTTESHFNLSESSWTRSGVFRQLVSLSEADADPNKNLDCGF